MLTLEKGRPKDTAGRLPKEIRTYDLLDSLGIPYERIDHPAAETMEACVEIDKALAPAAICKNLFLCNAKKDSFYLLMLCGEKKFQTAKVSRQVHSTRLSFASPEDMEKYLDILPGSVSVMGLMNDREHQVKLLVDRDLLQAEYFGCHPCINTSSLRLKTEDVLGRFLEAVGHDYTLVDLDEE